jgi:hypothetical protein
MASIMDLSGYQCCTYSGTLLLRLMRFTARKADACRTAY